MSVTDSSPTDIEKSCVVAHERPEDRRNDGANEETGFLSGSNPDRSTIQRVLKEVGLTSTTFIGPKFPPNKATLKLDDTLDEFYKEIEMINTPTPADDNSGETVDFVLPHPSPVVSTNTNRPDRNNRNTCAKPFNCQQSSGERPSSWPHWYQNEPYVHRRPRESINLIHSASPTNQSRWHHSQTINRPRPLNLIHHRPPLYHPPAFLYPPNPRLHENQSSGGSTITVQRPYFPTQNISPSNVSCHSSQVPFSSSLQGCSFLTHSGDNLNVGLSRVGKQQFCQLDEGYDRRHSRDSENCPWKHHCQTPADLKEYRSTMVLILMRGLPGSGKSTLAR